MKMNLKQAKEALRNFTQGKILTFKVKEFEDGTWMAECEQIPAVTTCGESSDRNEMESLMKDAILTAAGIEVEDKYIDQLIYDASVKKDFAVAA